MYEELATIVGNVISVHPIVHPLADGSGSDKSTTIEAGIVAGLALVFSTLLPTLFGKKEREPKAVRDLRSAELQLRKALEADVAEQKAACTVQAQMAQKAIDHALELDAEIDRLRRLCVDHQLNPFPPVKPAEDPA